MKKLLLAISTLTSLPLCAEGLNDRKVGTPPTAAETPKIEFAFEERVTIDPAVVLGDTALGYRQYIPITGGTIAGPKLEGVVLPGGYDFQLTYSASKCSVLSADYFLKAKDGAVIHVFNQGMFCPGAASSYFQPKLEAPNGPHGWMTNATFVATLEVEAPTKQADGTSKVEAVRIRFYQVK